MANGLVKKDSMPRWIDYGSLLGNILNKQGVKPSGYSTVNKWRFIFNQDGGLSLAELSEKGEETITFPTTEKQIYIWAENDDATSQGVSATVKYKDSDGVEKTTTATTNSTNGTTAAIITGADDFLRIEDFKISFKATATTGYFAIGNSGKTEIYAIIEEGYFRSVHSRYFGRKGCDIFLTKMCITSAVATAIVAKLQIEYTLYGETLSQLCQITIPSNAQEYIYPLVQLAEAKDIIFKIIGNNVNVGIDIEIIECVRFT